VILTEKLADLFTDIFQIIAQTVTICLGEDLQQRGQVDFPNKYKNSIKVGKNLNLGLV
jgi:hypothetical protein